MCRSSSGLRRQPGRAPLLLLRRDGGARWISAVTISMRGSSSSVTVAVTGSPPLRRTKRSGIGVPGLALREHVGHGLRRRRRPRRPAPRADRRRRRRPCRAASRTARRPTRRPPAADCKVALPSHALPAARLRTTRPMRAEQPRVVGHVVALHELGEELARERGVAGELRQTALQVFHRVGLRHHARRALHARHAVLRPHQLHVVVERDLAARQCRAATDPRPGRARRPTCSTR